MLKKDIFALKNTVTLLNGPHNKKKQTLVKENEKCLTLLRTFKEQIISAKISLSEKEAELKNVENEQNKFEIKMKESDEKIHSTTEHLAYTKASLDNLINDLKSRSKKLNRSIKLVIYFY